jgi:hypothetical protein
MCMPTSSPTTNSRPAGFADASFDTSRHSRTNKRGDRLDRLDLSSFAARVRELACAVVLVAFVGQKGSSQSRDISESELPCYEFDTTDRDTDASTATALLAQFLATLSAVLALTAGSIVTWSVLLGGGGGEFSRFVVLSFTRSRKWLADCFSLSQSAMSNVSSSATITRIRSTVHASSKRLFALSKRGSNSHHSEKSQDRTLAISDKAPFLSESAIAALTLVDVKDLFQHSAGLNGLNHPTVVNSNLVVFMRPSLQSAIDAMNRVLTLSRGADSNIPNLRHQQQPRDAVDATTNTTTINPSSSSWHSLADMDALAFVAVCRIFAEWRSIRLVPDGCHGYAVGMGLARRDLLANVAKMEKAVHSYIVAAASAHQPPALDTPTMDKSSSSETRDIKSPTLRQLLWFEVERGLHHRRPRIADKSGASGLLWTIRQLRYQTSVLANMTRVPLAYPNTKAAVHAAYHSTYHAYHGFLTRQIFLASLDAAPDVHVILHHMNHFPSAAATYHDDYGLYDEDNLTPPPSDDDDHHAQQQQQQNGVETWVQLGLDLSERSVQPVAESARRPSQSPPVSPPQEHHPLELLGGHLAKEWLKLHRFVGQCTGREAPKHHSRNVFDTGEPFSSLTASSSTTTMAVVGHGAFRQVEVFVGFMLPLLSELDDLINELNLNDPTKV